MVNQHARWRLFHLFRRLYLPVWFVGSALVVLSWNNVVTPRIGWIGFYAACGAACVSYVLSWVVHRQKEDDFVYLDSGMLKFKDGQYHDAVARFTEGADLLYDGVRFGIRPNNEIACAIVSPSTIQRFDDQAARGVAEHAETVFKDLKAKSPDIAIAVADLQFRISILANAEPYVDEVCRIVGGEVQWNDHHS